MITDYIGKPIEEITECLPDNRKTKSDKVIQSCCGFSIRWSYFSIRNTAKIKVWKKAHLTAVAVTGGVGGFFGLPVGWIQKMLLNFPTWNKYFILHLTRF